MVHFDAGWVDITAGNARHIAQLELLTRAAANRHGFEFVFCIKLSTDTNLKYVNRRLHGAGVFNRVFLAELRQDCRNIKAKLCEFFLWNFNEDFFVLHAKLFNLGHKGNAQKLLAHVVGKTFDFGWRETRSIERVDHAKHITKFVIEKRPLHPCRQGVANVTNFFAHRVPNIGYICGLGIVFDLKNDL